MGKLLLISKRFLGVFMIVSLGLFGCLDDGAHKSDNHFTVLHPATIDEPLTNPGMGWMIEEFENVTPSEACRTNDFPLVDTVEVIATWSAIERVPPSPEPIYDWEAIDEIIDHWANVKSKNISLRISTEDIGCYLPFCDESAPGYRSGFRGIPEWLALQLTQTMQKRTDDVVFEFPDYQDSIYRDSLVSFLDAYAGRYRNHSSVDLVNIRGYGAWGEWHSGHDIGVADNQNQRVETLQWIIDSWSNPWQNQKILLLSNSYEWRSPSELNPDTASIEVYREWEDAYSHYKKISAFDYAWNVPMVSFRRDGFNVDDTVNPEFDGRLLKDFFENSPKKLPIVAEFMKTYAEYKRLGAVDAIISKALSYHANYIMMPGWACGAGQPLIESAAWDAEVFYSERQDLILSGLKKGGMGYRFELQKIEIQRNFGENGRVSFRSWWRNVNVGRAITDFDLQYVLEDSNGVVVWIGTETSLDVRDFVGDKSYEVSSDFVAPILDVGSYTLKIAFVNPLDVSKNINLPLLSKDEFGRYPIAEIQVGL